MALTGGIKLLRCLYVKRIVRDITSGHVQYRKNSKYWDMYVWANSLDSDQTALKEQSDQDLHRLPF